MRQLFVHKNLLKASLLFAVLISIWLVFIIMALTASAAELVFDWDGLATGGWVGQLVEFKSSTAGMVGNPSGENYNSSKSNTATAILFNPRTNMTEKHQLLMTDANGILGVIVAG